MTGAVDWLHEANQYTQATAHLANKPSHPKVVSFIGVSEHANMLRLFSASLCQLFAACREIIISVL